MEKCCEQKMGLELLKYQNGFLNKHIKNQSEKLGLYKHFFTFRDNGYEKNIITIVLCDDLPKDFICTADGVQRDIKILIETLIKINSHLILKVKEIGMNNDDFAMGRVSALIEIKEKQTKKVPDHNNLPCASLLGI